MFILFALDTWLRCAIKFGLTHILHLVITDPRWHTL